MPQPGEVEAAAGDLIRLYAAAEQRLLDRYMAILADPQRSTEASRLRDLLRQVDGELGRLDVKTRDWFRTRYPAIYQLGATDVAAGAFSWTQQHREAAQALAARSYEDLLANTRHAGASLKRAVRDSAARDSARSILDGTTTPQRAAVDMRRRVQAETGASTVTYSNGAKHSLADYADTAIRTTTVTAYNEGGFTQAHEDGVQWMEVFDGLDCGWVSHDDSDKAAGTIRRIEDCEAHSISHPRCARSFSPRPDITTAKSAEAARRYTPEEQAQLAADEKARADAAPVRLARPENRQPRVARALNPPPRPPRTPRTPRAPKPPASAGPVAPKRPPWTPLARTADVTREFRDRWGTTSTGAARSVGFDGMKPDVANAVAAQLDYLMGRFPKTADSIKALGSPKAIKDRFPIAPRMRGNAYADSAGEPYQWIRVKSTLPYDDFLKHLAKDEATGFHPPGTATIEAVVTHEYGHRVEGLASARVAQQGRSLQDEIEDLVAQAVGASRSSRGYLARRYDTIRTEVSRYATRNWQELVAESFSMVEHGTPSPLARAIVDLIVREAEA